MSKTPVPNVHVGDALQLAKSNFCLLRLLADRMGEDSDCDEKDEWAWYRIQQLCDEGIAALEAADNRLASVGGGK